MIYSRIVMKMM